MLQIQGLTPLQVELADCLWQCETYSDVETFLGSLPKRLAAQAQVVLELMTAAALDDIGNDDLALAKSVIDSVK